MKKATIVVLAIFCFSSIWIVMMCSGDRDSETIDSEPAIDTVTTSEPEKAVKSLGPEPLSEVDRLLDEMEFGTIAFNTPTKINIDASFQIQLILSLAATVEELKQSIKKEGKRVGAKIKVSDKMEARLTGYMFQITAITPEIQAVSRAQQTEWKWEIHPKEEGQHELHLTITAHLDVNGEIIPRKIKTFDRIIAVDVTATQKAKLFFENNWQWLWAAILVPVIGWLWKRKKKQPTNTSN